MILLGSIVNVITILIGALLGFFLEKLFRKHPRLASLPEASMKAISICVLYIGISGALDSTKPIVLLVSMVVGTVIGTLIDIDGLLERLGKFIERKFVRGPAVPTGIDELDEERNKKSIAKGFISTTLTCCVGALSIMGALESGLSGNHELLFTKSVLDFVTALVFSSSFGLGAMLAAVPVFIYQGSITLGASLVSEFISGSINEISAVGSLIVACLGLNMLGATKIKVANMLPAVFLPILLCLFL